ncbi:MAG: SAP domain-containing protein [Prevotellaceae bacterium]|nr:SAP domain-containing protein [Prevotellaceae bacterium]
MKEEPVQFCKAVGINSPGGKLDVTKRIITFLKIKTIMAKDETKNVI